jgi:multiple sugar transport system permease protein
MSSWRQQREAWLLLAPALIILAIVTVWPLARTVWLSFTDAKITALKVPVHFIGFENYAWTLTDPYFLKALIRTVYFTVVSVALETVIAIAVALLLNMEFHGRNVLRALIILPWAIPTIVNAIMWKLIFHPEYGSLNAALTQLGLAGSYRSWLGDVDTAMNMIVLADVWKNYPLIAFVVLAALQTIPQELYDAARMDGANAWQRFTRITLPGILGPLMVVVVLRTIESFRVFDIIYVMTRGGPADATKTASFFVYQEIFTYLRAGSGAAYAVVVALISALMIALYFGALRATNQRGMA